MLLDDLGEMHGGKTGEGLCEQFGVGKSTAYLCLLRHLYTCNIKNPDTCNFQISGTFPETTEGSHLNGSDGNTKC